MKWELLRVPYGAFAELNLDEGTIYTIDAQKNIISFPANEEYKDVRYSNIYFESLDKDSEWDAVGEIVKSLRMYTDTLEDYVNNVNNVNNKETEQAKGYLMYYDDLNTMKEYNGKYCAWWELFIAIHTETERKS